MRYTLMVVFVLALVGCGSCQLNIIKDLIQRNLLGLPVLHQTVEWPFDPEEGIRRSRFYQENNGRYGEKAIERLGLGVDGYDRERLAAQRARDEGHLGGLNNLQP